MHFEFESDNIALPVNIKPEEKLYFQKCCFWKYTNPKITRHSFVIVYPKGYCTDFLLRPIKYIAPWKEFYNNFNKAYFLGVIKNFIEKKRIRFISKPLYYYCINEFSGGYFHWFTEVLPKILYVLKNINSDSIFYFPFKLSPYHSLSLDQCNVNYFAQEGHLQIFKQLNVVENMTVYPGIYHPDLLFKTVNLIKRSILQTDKKSRKIYITRKNATRRKLINENEIIEILVKYGFEILDFDRIDYKEQLKIMNETRILVSMHGAALTNMMFMPQGSIVVELLPIEITNDKCYFILAGALKHFYYYVDCKIDGTNHITSDFIVNANLLEAALNQAMHTQ